jgi:ATP-dependent Clp protease adaptor protein ClpS
MLGVRGDVQHLTVLEVDADLDCEPGESFEAFVRARRRAEWAAHRRGEYWRCRIPLGTVARMPPATDTPTRERLDRGLGGGLGEPWNVVVLNDNHNTFEGVAFALSSVLPSVGYDAGMRLASTIHFSGSAVVWAGHQELAELYWSRLSGFGLTMAPLGG